MDHAASPPAFDQKHQFMIDESQVNDASGNESPRETKLQNMVNFLMARRYMEKEAAVTTHGHGGIQPVPAYTAYPTIVVPRPPKWDASRKLTLFTLLMSIVTICLLIANYNVAVNSPFTAAWYTWDAGRANIALIVIMAVTLVYSFVNLVYAPSFLVLQIVESAIFANIIPQIVRLFSGFPNFSWCSAIFITISASDGVVQHDVPIHCKEWLWSIYSLSSFAGAFAVIISAIYLGRVIKRIADYKRRSAGGRTVGV